MIVAGYVSPLIAYETPTGVGQHICGMFSALEQRTDISFRLVAPAGKLREAEKMLGRHAQPRIIQIPCPDRPLRLTTTLTSAVSLDPWLGEAEWVYTPGEQPVTTRRKLAVTIHDLYPWEPQIDGIPDRKKPGLSWRRRMARILERAELIVTVSEFTKSRLLALFDVPRRERIVVVGNGGAEGFSALPDVTDGAVLSRFNLQAQTYVLFPASLTRKKGGDTLLSTAGLAAERGLNLSFVVIGRRHDSDLQSSLERLRRKVPAVRVVMAGYVGRAELAALYRHASATLMLSRYEGFGIPVIEALASGSPLCISPQPALVEVAAGSATLVERDAESVLHGLAASRSREPLLNAAARRAAAHTWERCVERLVHSMTARRIAA